MGSRIPKHLFPTPPQRVTIVKIVGLVVIVAITLIVIVAAMSSHSMTKVPTVKAVPILYVVIRRALPSPPPGQNPSPTFTELPGRYWV